MENELLLARVEDALNTVYNTDKPKFLGFLSKEEAILVKKFLDNRKADYLFFGGEHSAQRVYLCCYPDWLKNLSFPIKAVTLTYRLTDVVRHRDILGTLVALGLKRESVGDILIEQGRAVVFLSEEIADFVLQNLNKVGRIGVKVTSGYTAPLPASEILKESSVTVASLRLDCVVSACANCSRNSATDFIESGLVSVNSVVCQKATRFVCDGDVISVRKKGKFVILSTGKKTKKDRIVLNFKSY